MELGCHSRMDCLAADRVQERSKAGRWSWADIAQLIVMLLTESRRGQRQGGGAGLT